MIPPGRNKYGLTGFLDANECMFHSDWKQRKLFRIVIKARVRYFAIRPTDVGCLQRKSKRQKTISIFWYFTQIQHPREVRPLNPNVDLEYASNFGLYRVFLSKLIFLYHQIDQVTKEKSKLFSDDKNPCMDLFEAPCWKSDNFLQEVQYNKGVVKAGR